MNISDYYAAHGYIIMASVAALPLGPLERNDWNEDDMCQHRWRVVGVANRLDLVVQNWELGFDNPIAPQFRFFYRVEAMD